MSIVIQNISPDAPLSGVNRYVVRINQKVICEFKHNRQVDGLAQCLRDAAEAVDKSNRARLAELINHLQFVEGEGFISPERTALYDHLERQAWNASKGE